MKDRNSNETSRIEHVLSREKHPDRELDYHNMVICCPGAISSDFHCDKLKGNEDLTFNLFDDELFTSLSYKSKSGKIVSANEDYDRQINQLLNLNNRWLMANRLQALLGVIDYLNQMCIRDRVSRVAVGMLFLSASSKACCRLKESGRAAKRASWGVGVRERGTSSDGSRESMPAE